MRYKKKPVVIDAEPYRRGLEDGIEVQITNMRGELLEPVTFTTESVWEKLEKFKVNYEKEFIIANIKPFIFTLEGKMYINSDDMIITGVKGEKYPCKKDIFEMTYEKEGINRYKSEEDELWKKTMSILRELNIDVLTEMGCYRRFNEVMIDIEKVYNNGTERNKELIRQLFL